MGYLSWEDEIAKDGERDKTKLLGYANVIQNSMLFQCEAVSNGVYTGGGKPDISDGKRKRLNRVNPKSGT